MGQLRLEAHQTALAEAIWESGAFKLGAFRLKLHETNPTAPLSPYYISMREADVEPGAFPGLLEQIARSIHTDSLRMGVMADCIVGIPNAGNSIADGVSELSGLAVLRLDFPRQLQEYSRFI